ncbi:MAG: hypothetical protein AAFP69_15450, partial [Planctomycetota bacterium]
MRKQAIVMPCGSVSILQSGNVTNHRAAANDTISKQTQLGGFGAFDGYPYSVPITKWSRSECG